ncbi:MAG: hypothetical protein WC156_14330 [Pedobacter sp.]
MTTTFRKLFTLNVAHGYYSDSCRDFSFIVSAAMTGLLRNAKLIAKALDGKLNVLYEVDEGGAALVPIAGTKLRFGMKLLNPLFSNVTEFSVTTPLFRNTGSVASLDPAMEVVMTGRLISHAVTKTIRPVTVTVKDSAGQMLQTETITTANNRSTISCDLSGQAAGTYSVVEDYPAETETTTYYSDIELLQAGVFGVVEIVIDSDFYASRPSFTISFNAKQETLKYYVVAGNYNAAEFNHLSVADNGFAEDGRPMINFTRVTSDAFTTDEISPGMLAKANDKVVLFKSQALVARQEIARKNIQLSKNGDILIKHLPQIGADNVNGDIIIHISKP